MEEGIRPPRCTLFSAVLVHLITHLPTAHIENGEINPHHQRPES